MGQVEPYVEVSPKELVETKTNEEPVGLVNRIDNVEEQRMEKLKGMLKVSKDGLTRDEQQRVCDFVLKSHDVFALSELERGEVEGIRRHWGESAYMPITQESSPGLQSKSWWMTCLGQKLSKNQVASGVVLVKKNSGEYRICVDYRALNVFPMPRIDDQLGGKKIFSTLDACSGYWQIKMGVESQEKTAFSAHDGLYDFRVMLFGGPATLMHHTLRGCSEFCNVYIDDMIVFSSSVDEHMEHLRLVFNHLYSLHLICPPIHSVGTGGGVPGARAPQPFWPHIILYSNDIFLVTLSTLL